MSRYIDAEKLCFEILEEYGISTGGDDVTEIYSMIINQPTVDVRENVKGHWIDKSQGVWVVKQCSACNGICDYQFNFCPNCGADMRHQS